MTREEWKQYERKQNDPDVKLAMRARCEEQGHDWENAMTATFSCYQKCKWCGECRR